MVVGQALDHGVDRHQAGRRQHPYLAHAGAQDLAPAGRLVDEVAAAAHHAAHRAGEPLRQAYRHRIRRRGQIRGRRFQGHRRVEQPRPVQVHAEAGRARRAGHGRDLCRVQRSPGTGVVGVLDAQQAGARAVVVVRLDGGSDRLRRQLAAGIGGQREQHHAAEHRGAPGLVLEDVRLIAEQDLFAAPRLRQHRNQVALRAGGHEQARLLAEQRRHPLLQAIHGGVVAVHVVAELGVVHGAPHVAGRVGHGVAAQVNHRARHCGAWWLPPARAAASRPRDALRRRGGVTRRRPSSASARGATGGATRPGCTAPPPAPAARARR